MKSGLEGRNNAIEHGINEVEILVSMKSGLEGRNNSRAEAVLVQTGHVVSMKSGLEGRNNQTH